MSQNELLSTRGTFQNKLPIGGTSQGDTTSIDSDLFDSPETSPEKEIFFPLTRAPDSFPIPLLPSLPTPTGLLRGAIVSKSIAVHCRILLVEPIQM